MMVPSWMRLNTDLASLLQCLATLRFNTMTIHTIAQVGMDLSLNTRSMARAFNDCVGHSFTIDGWFWRWTL